MNITTFIRIITITRVRKRSARPSRKRLHHFHRVLPVVLFPLLLLGCTHDLRPTRDIAGGIPVQFSYLDAQAGEVALVGSFVRWSPQPMARQGQAWTLTVFLAPGRYHYAFLIDGRRWQFDPGALLFEDNDFGGENSVLIVE